MMGAAQRWTIAGLAGLSMLAVAASAGAQYGGATAEKKEVLVTNADRTYWNYTRDAATVDSGQLRLEFRAFRVEENEDGGNPDCRGPLRKNCARLNGIGQRIIGVEDVNSGKLELVSSYGIAKNAEIGLIIPGIIESFKRDDGTKSSFADIGDLTVYGKFVQPVLENLSVGGGLELVFPPWKNLDKQARTVQSGAAYGAEGSFTGTSTGELGINPFLTSRYTMGRVAVGAHIGYNFYTGDDVEEVLNYSSNAIYRFNETYAVRLELNGRMWDQFGVKWHDVALMPGIDFAMSETITIRPTGLVNLTNTAMDWGIGFGIATVF